MMNALPPSAHFSVRICDARMFVRIRGQGQAIFLLHGGGPGTCGDGWHKLIDGLASRWQTYTPDFAGFGYSSSPGENYGSRDFAADVIELMNTLCLEHVILVGHSMGAAIAAEVATRQPQSISRLILIAPGGGSYGLDYHSPGIEQIARIAQSPTEENMRALVQLMSSRPEFHEREIAKRMRMLERPGILSAQRQLQQSRSTRRTLAPGAPTLAEKMRNLTLPMDLIWGEYERFNPVSLGPLIKAKLPSQVQYHVIPDAGHNVHYDQPEAVARLLERIMVPTAP